MTYFLLLVAHIAVLGYWLGSDLCINSEYRFITHRSDIDFAARDAMTDHLMDVDQHVRYALILQLTLGVMLASHLRHLPDIWFWFVPVIGAAWLALVEVAHRRRTTLLGERLAQIDRWVRYAIAIALLAAAFGLFGVMPLWLRAKLALFAALIGCGVIIRLFLIRHFRVWSEMRREGPSESHEVIIRATYLHATSVLIVLWSCVAGIVALAVLKPF